MTFHTSIALRMLTATILVMAFVLLGLSAMERMSSSDPAPAPIAITDFSSCAAAGHLVAESMPRRCTTPDGRLFIEEISPRPADPPPIVVTSPAEGAFIADPTVVKGFARGYWYFEASFPIEIRDGNGTLIAQGSAQAESDWMTEAYVPFSASLTWIAKPLTDTGVIILQKDNPSGLKEHAASVEIPVSFTPLSGGIIRVNVFFAYTAFINQPVGFDLVLPVIRDIPATTSIARATLEELLKGPTPQEIARGYSTHINPKTIVRKITIDASGTATVDLSSERFSDTEWFVSPGTPAIAYFERQISETLRQFPSIKHVRYLFDGKEPMWDP